MEVNKKNIMVCVTGQRSCERLIARGKERKGTDSVMYVVHCVQTGHNFMNSLFESDAIEYLFTAAQLAGAELSLLRADNIDDAIVDYAIRNEVNIIIMGVSQVHDKNAGNNIVMRLQRRLADIEFDIVG